MRRNHTVNLSATLEAAETNNSAIYSPGLTVTLCHPPVLSVCKTVHVMAPSIIHNHALYKEEMSLSRHLL